MTISQNEPLYRFVADVIKDDLIADRFLPLGMPARVVQDPYPYRLADKDWVFLTVRYPNGVVDGVALLAGGALPVTNPR